MDRQSMQRQEKVDHPAHYTSHPSGIECIQVVEHMNFNIGNAIEYLWRAGLKTSDPIEDLKKAAWHVNREVERLSKREARSNADTLRAALEAIRIAAEGWEKRHDSLTLKLAFQGIATVARDALRSGQ